MSRTFHHGERRIRVRGIKRDPADLRRLARALIELAQAQAEAEASTDRKKQTPRNRKQRNSEGYETAGGPEPAGGGAA